jgi:RNA polymerase sigma factor (sigma-70 family)
MQGSEFPLGAFAMIADATSGVARHHRLAPALREEWEQVAWLKAIKIGDLRAVTFRGEASHRTYLGCVLDNCCIDWLRRRARSQKHTIGVDDAATALNRASARAFFDASIGEDERRRYEHRSALTRAALGQLDPADSALLIAYFSDRRTRRALLNEAGCTPEALRQRAHRAVIRLRRLMAQIARPPARPPAYSKNLKLET